MNNTSSEEPLHIREACEIVAECWQEASQDEELDLELEPLERVLGKALERAFSDLEARKAAMEETRHLPAVESTDVSDEESFDDPVVNTICLGLRWLWRYSCKFAKWIKAKCDESWEKR